MEFTKSSWFVAGVVAGAVAIAGIVLVINDGALSPKVARAASLENVQGQLEQRSFRLLNNINRICEKIDAKLDPYASSDAKAAALKSGLRTLRSQIELFHLQHLSVWPDENIMDQLTKKTNISGQVEGASGASGPFSYGPYLCKIPTNPFTKNSRVETGTGKPGGGNAGWYYNTKTGKFFADDEAHKGL